MIENKLTNFPSLLRKIFWAAQVFHNFFENNSIEIALICQIPIRFSCFSVILFLFSSILMIICKGKNIFIFQNKLKMLRFFLVIFLIEKEEFYLFF